MRAGSINRSSKRVAFVYLRVSPRTEAQKIQSVSIETQEAKCRDHALRLDVPVEAVFKDEFISGKDGVEHRPGLAALLKAARANPDAIVIVYSVSRLARRQSLLWHLLDGEGLAISSATEPFDTSTPMGRAMLGMIGVWAQLEADMVSERTRDALALVKANGTQLGRKTVGETNPELIAQVQAMHATGLYSHQALADKLNAMGLKTPGGGEKWFKNTVQRALAAKI